MTSGNCSVDDTAKCLSGEQIIFIALLNDVRAGPCQMSLPPRRHYELTFDQPKFFRGGQALNNVDVASLRFRYVDSSHAGKNPKSGTRYVVGAHQTDGNGNRNPIVVVEVFEFADAELTQLCMEMSSVPAAWIRQRGGGWQYPIRQPVESSPRWWSLYEDPNILKCVKTRRPALLCRDENITLKVEQVIPDDAQKRMAPYGDGEFKITITNTGESDVQVPCVLCDPATLSIAWEDSLLIVDAETKDVYTLKGACEKHSLVPYTLPGRSSVNAIVNCLTLDGGSHWSVGGVRVYLNFCIGELVAQNFFYYYCAAHSTLHENSKGRCAIRNC